MVHISQCFEIYSIEEKGVNYLHFMFTNKLTHESSKKACQRLIKEIEGKSSKVILVWNCLCMDGFEWSGGREWINALKTLKSKITKVITISDSTFTRKAIHMMLQMLEIQSEEVKSNNLALTPYLA